MADVKLEIEQSIQSHKKPVEEAAQQKAQWIREMATESPLTLIVENYVLEPRPFPQIEYNEYNEQEVSGPPPPVVMGPQPVPMGPMRAPYSARGAEAGFWKRVIPSQISLRGRREQRIGVSGEPSGPFIGPLPPVPPGQVPGQREAPPFPPYEAQRGGGAPVPRFPRPRFLDETVMMEGVPCRQRAPYNLQSGCRFADIDSLSTTLIRKLGAKRDFKPLEALENLEDLVRFVESCLVPIPGDVATTIHADACMKAQPALVRALRAWKVFADLKCIAKVRAGEKPEGELPVLGLLHITSCYRRLGTTCDFDTNGVYDAGVDSGHWSGYAVDVTVEGKNLRDYFGSTYDPPLTPDEITKAGIRAGLLRDTLNPQGKLELHHWRVPKGIPNGRTESWGLFGPHRDKDTSLPWPYGSKR